MTGEVVDVVVEKIPTLTKEEEMALIEQKARAMEADEKQKVYQGSLDVICRDFPPTELGNSRRFFRRFGKNVRYCHPWRAWFIWDGSRWAIDDTGKIVVHGKYTVNQIEKEALLFNYDQQKILLAWSGASQKYSVIKNTISLAASDVPVLPNELDADKNLINFPNGTLEIDTGTFREHRQADLCSKVMGAHYDPEAKCPMWEKFIGEIFIKEPEEGKDPESDEDLIKFVQRAMGYTLTAEIKERAIFLCHGSGANGKSTLLNTIAAAMGDYAQQTESSTFTVAKRETVRNDLAALKGSRMVLALESGKDKRLDEALIKQLSGGDKIAARFLFREYFEYTPEFKIWWGFNHRPRIDDATESIWDRIKLIPFNLRIEEEKRDLDLPTKLLAELPGIINWMLTGLKDYQGKGLAEPEIVKAATSEYQADQDVLGEWISDQCVKGRHLWEASAELYTNYHEWSTNRQETPMTPRKFGIEMGDRFKRVRGGPANKKGYQGIGLKGQERITDVFPT